MSHTSPATYLVWTILSMLLGAFLLFHLWSFDRFRCLKWDNGPYSGSFRRVMTYAYFLSIPLCISNVLGMTIIKYQEGFTFYPGLGVFPKQYFEWAPASRNAIFPLLVAGSVSWGLEQVTHLEELCFWMFLINAGSDKQDWFLSPFFKLWVVGSAISITYMPLVTIFTRSDPLYNEAATFLASTLGNLLQTLLFIPIQWSFPKFLRSLREEGVDTAAIVRLTKFSELNMIRQVFRFVYVIPFLILATDGLRPHKHVNESMFWTDLLAIIGAFGMVVSSAITLTIFFPRNIENEIAAQDAARERKRVKMQAKEQKRLKDAVQQHQRRNGSTYLLTSSPIRKNIALPGFEGDLGRSSASPTTMKTDWYDEEREMTQHVPHIPAIRPNRRRDGDVELGGIDNLTEGNLSQHNLRASNFHPMLYNYTSPIDLVYMTRADDFNMS